MSILGSSNPEDIQPHMLKLYDNCKKLVFGRNNTVVGMISDEGETFSFLNPTKADGPVEQWMSRVDEAMIETLHRLSKEGVYYYAESDRV